MAQGGALLKFRKTKFLDKPRTLLLNYFHFFQCRNTPKVIRLRLDNHFFPTGNNKTTKHPFSEKKTIFFQKNYSEKS